jgi:hypothetical protein
MHIKKVIIKGFKSYSSQSDFDTFHSRTNVIGKANINLEYGYLLKQYDKFSDFFSNQLVKTELANQTSLMVSNYINIYK